MIIKRQNKIKSLVGQKFGKLLVLEMLGNDKRNTVIYKCRCDCPAANELNVRSDSLRDGNTKSCGCLRKYSDREFLLKKRLYVRCATKSKIRNIVNHLTFDEFCKIIQSPCFYCDNKGYSIKKDIRSDNSGELVSNHTISYNGIDRIDNDLPYVEKNCVSCCFICNRAKNNMKMIDFLNWFKILSKNFIKSDNDNVDYVEIIKNKLNNSNKLCNLV